MRAPTCRHRAICNSRRQLTPSRLTSSLHVGLRAPAPMSTAAASMTSRPASRLRSCDRAAAGGRRTLCRGAGRLRLRAAPPRLPAARTTLHARCRRQAARRRVRPGRHHQQLHRRRRRQGQSAADRRGPGARAHQPAARGAIADTAQARLRARAARERRGRNLSAVLHPRRGDDARPISLRRQHDGGDRGRDRRRFCAARLQEHGRTHAQGRRPADPREVPLEYPVRPGDTILVKERWF